jgi:hypothetical protein
MLVWVGSGSKSLACKPWETTIDKGVSNLLTLEIRLAPFHRSISTPGYHIHNAIKLLGMTVLVSSYAVLMPHTSHLVFALRVFPQPLYFLNVLSLTFRILLAETPRSPDCFDLMLASLTNLYSSATRLSPLPSGL